MSRGGLASRLRRDLGTLESYAALLGILIGAGIFRVTAEAGALTGPSTILAHLVLAPAVLATSVAYCVYLSTPLGTGPGGEYTHISATFGGRGVAFVGAWLKIVSYVGALAYLANAFADYVVQISAGRLEAGAHRLPLALGGLCFFYAAHVAGVRWFGRLQVGMCALLGASLLVLILPGLPAIRLENLRPFFTQGAGGFATALPILFFSYAGFESLAQTAGEVKESSRRLPRVFLKGLVLTTCIFVLMSVVAFGVVPLRRLEASPVPMVVAASTYLPWGAAWFVSLGAIMAITTSLNATMLVPSRLGVILAQENLIPAWIGSVHPATGTPLAGLSLTLAASAALLVSGQIALALSIAVFALVILYFLHSLALLLLPRLNPSLLRQATTKIGRTAQRRAAIVSVIAMGGLILLQVAQDIRTLAASSLARRIAERNLTTVELTLVWGLVGAGLYALASRRRVGRAR